MRIPKPLWLLVPTVLLVTYLEAGEITATVVRIESGTVQLKVTGELLPAVGDKVEIYEVLPDVELEATVARGEVEADRNGHIHVKITSSSSPIRTDHKARINSPNPNRATAERPHQPVTARANGVIEGWGTLEDQEGKARVVQRDNGIELSIPGVYRDIWPGVAVNAPRLLRRVSGDFAVQVKVVSPVDVTGKTLTAKRPVEARFLFRAACLLVWHDEKNFVRLERSSSLSRPHRWGYQAFDQGRRAATQAGEVRKEGESWLRIQRKDGVVYAWYRQAGDEAWTAMEVERLSLPDEVTVGVAVLNSTSDPFMVRFEDFVFEK